MNPFHCTVDQAQALAGSATFFALGLGGGLHCMGMCGPLACLLGRPEERPLARLGLYHLGRFTAYASLGAVLAAAGAPLRPLLSWPLLAALAVLPLLAYAISPRDRGPAFLGRWHGAGARRLMGLPPASRALGLGLLTPVLPCGILYTAAGAAVAAPGPGQGALWMASFAAGTLPLVLVGQLGFSWAARRGQGAWLPLLRRGSALLAALTLLGFAIYRAA